jgi:hypothetical protein
MDWTWTKELDRKESTGVRARQHIGLDKRMNESRTVLNNAIGLDKRITGVRAKRHYASGLDERTGRFHFFTLKKEYSEIQSEE